MQIAMIAISATGSVHPERAGPGFQQAAFASRNQAIDSLPSLALLTLAGMTPPEHTCRYIEVRSEHDFEELPRDVELVCLSSYSAQIHLAYAVARHYRELGIPTVIGGPHVSCLPEEAATHCDAVAIGEGETCWHAILEDAAAKSLKQFYGSLNATFDMQNAVMPAYELLDHDNGYARITLETSRGCPHRCEFCASSVLLAQKYKQKPIDKVLAEVDRIKECWPRPFLELADDNTFVNRKYWMKLLPELKKRKVRWFAEADIRLGNDPELLDMLAESGCKEVLIGFESTSPGHLDGLELRADWKSKQRLDPREAVTTIQKHGIMVVGCFVFGLDSQDTDIFDDVYKFVCDTHIYDVQMTLLTPFPGTPLYDRLQREGRLLKENAWERCTLFDINFMPKNMSVETLTEAFANLAVRVFDDEFTAARRRELRRQIVAFRRSRRG